MVVSWCWKQEAIAHCYSAGIAQLVKNLSALQETPVPFLGREDLLEKERLPTPVFLGFPGDSAGKESTCNAGGSIPGLGRSSGEGNSYPLQCSGLENSMNCTVHGVAKSWTRLSSFHFHFQDILKDSGTLRDENKDS